MRVRVACLLGARANAWHTEVLRELPDGVEATVVGTTDPRYPTSEIAAPFLALPRENEVGPWPVRKLRNLRYRLSHRRTGFEHRLAPGGRLAPFDLLDSCELFTEWTRAALDEKRARGVPVVVSVWDNIPGHFADHPRRGPVRRRALAEADRFLVLGGRAEAALCLDGVEPARIVRARPSVDPGRFRPRPPGPANGAGGAPADLTVLAVARLVPEKGIAVLLDGLALALGREPRLRLVVAGDGPERPALAARAARLGIAGRVAFHGEVRHATMPELHALADLFVLPSIPTPDWQEQWGQSLLEAMASATACVASDSGGIPEVLGDTGVLVPPGDPTAIAATLVSLAADPAARTALGKRARTRVEAGFTHHDQARARARLYLDLAGARQDRA